MKQQQPSVLAQQTGLTKQQQFQYLKLLASLNNTKNPVSLQYLQIKQPSQLKKKSKSKQKTQPFGLKLVKGSSASDMESKLQSKSLQNQRNQGRQHISMSDVRADIVDRMSINQSQIINEGDEFADLSKQKPNLCQNYVTQSHENLTNDLGDEYYQNQLTEDDERIDARTPDLLEENPLLMENQDLKDEEITDPDGEPQYFAINNYQNDEVPPQQRANLIPTFMMREDQLPLNVGNVWDRLQPAKTKPVKETVGATNQDLIEMGCLETQLIEADDLLFDQPLHKEKRKRNSSKQTKQISTNEATVRTANNHSKTNKNVGLAYAESVRSKEIIAAAKRVQPAKLSRDNKFVSSDPYQVRKPRVQSAANKQMSQPARVHFEANKLKDNLPKNFGSANSDVQSQVQQTHSRQLSKQKSQEHIPKSPREDLSNQLRESKSQPKLAKKQKGTPSNKTKKKPDRPSIFERILLSNQQKEDRRLNSQSPVKERSNDQRNSINSTPKLAFKTSKQKSESINRVSRQGGLSKQLKLEENEAASAKRDKSLVSTAQRQATAKGGGTVSVLLGMSANLKTTSKDSLKTLDLSVQRRNDNSEKVQSPQRSVPRTSMLTKKQASLVKEPLGNSDLAKDGIVCKIDRTEPYIRRAVHRIGWQVQHEKDSSERFHIKFDVADIEVKLKAHQFYNHFPDNRELTTKAGLCKNLWTNCHLESELQVSHFFPRCYDLSDQRQVEHFTEDFNQTAILSIVKAYAQQFLKDPAIVAMCDEYNRKHEFACPRVFKQKFNDKHSEPASSGGTGLVMMAVSYCKNLIKQEKALSHPPNRKKAVVASTNFKFSPELVAKLVDFHQGLKAEDPKNQAQLFPRLVKLKIVRLHHKLEQMNAQYKWIDGCKNAWVVKPSYSARGLGIYCSDKLKEMINEGRKNQSKVVQKYVETPLLVSGRKFDLRQWVLVTSWEPLDVYVFDTAYLRLCSKEFTLGDLQDVYRHLSNYSIQKSKAEGPNVMSIPDFEQFLEQPGVWMQTIFPKLQDVVFRTLKAVQETQDVDYKSRCFEVYGFDIMIDQNLNPWVIEVNLSPACYEKRAQFLTQMLDDMAFDLVHYLERRILTSSMPEEHAVELSNSLKAKRNNYLKMKDMFESHCHLNSPDFYEQAALRNKWVRVDHSILECREHAFAMQAATQASRLGVLDLVGGKVDTRSERKLDLAHKKSLATHLIQRFWRGYTARVRVYFIRLTRAAIVAQKYARRVLAIKMRKWLKLQRSCIKVQCAVRLILARKLALKLQAERELNARTLVAVRLQSHFRRKRDTKVVDKMRLFHNSRLLQRYIKGRQAKQKMLKLRTERTMIVRIQRFIRRRFKKLTKLAIALQKYLRAYKPYHKFKMLRRVNRAANIALKLLNNRMNVQGLRGLQRHSSAIRIQCFVRRTKATRLLRAMKRAKAVLQVESMAEKIKNKAKVRKMGASLRLLKRLINSKAISIQRVLRKYRALGKIRACKVHLARIQAAVKIQSVVRMHIQMQYYQIQKHDRFIAASFIQHWITPILARIRT